MQNRENSGFINNGFMSNAGISHSLESRCEVEGNNQKFLKFFSLCCPQEDVSAASDPALADLGLAFSFRLSG